MSEYQRGSMDTLRDVLDYIAEFQDTLSLQAMLRHLGDELIDMEEKWGTNDE